ncbi:MAG: hypothetical protein FJ293_01110 [Planctomycetes bacterium]|nr:hypothetical protein [Planctomycetota bacterium]
MSRGRARKGWGAAATVASLLGASACGGGGGGNGAGNGSDLADPVIALLGTTGKYSQTPEEANASRGQLKPPVMPKSAGAANQFLRLEVPFDVRRQDVASPDPIFGAFSQLIGNLIVVDEQGAHVPGIVLVNGVDAFGRKRMDDPGFPQDLDGAGKNRNVGKGVILYVADDGDGDLSTLAAFGGRSNDSDSSVLTTDIAQLRISLGSLWGRSIDAFYTITVANSVADDATGPRVLSVVAETPDAEDPLDAGRCASTTRFIVRFSEPCVPTTVGQSAELDGTPYLGNMPLLPLPGSPPSKPLPHTHITATLNSNTAQLFLPCDVRPVNSNNLAAYFITPLIDLPSQREITLVIVDANANRDSSQTPFGPIDLVGNLHTPGADSRTNFTAGRGRVPCNAPVSPEVMYWLPISANGIGAIDLNGNGFNTNTPGRFSNADPANYVHAALITRFPDTVGGIGILGVSNRYSWPVGTGSFVYGPGFSINGQAWVGNSANDTGNSGTPIPGVNEMSAGFETLVRNAEGDVLLSGTTGGTLGIVNDMVVGDFLDAGIYDTQNIWAQASFRGSSRNLIALPVVPNPPPLRYWVGLNPIDILIDQNNPLAKARLIEGEEVWNGLYNFVVPDKVTALEIDDPPIGGGVNGPAPQTSTLPSAFVARQQIGNYLYVADATAGLLQVVNSNTFQVITSLDLPEPAGVAVRSDSRYVFTANAGDDTVSMIGSDPTQVDFHQELARIPVGRGPKAISCQGNGEDVLVVNSLDNTISIVELGTLTVRKTLDALIDGPREMVVTARQNGYGWNCGIYFAYIANFTGNNVVVYESGPGGPLGIGCDNVLGSLPTVDTDYEMFEPRGLCYSPFMNEQGLFAGGVFVAHRDNAGRGLLSHIQFTHQAFSGPLPCVLPPGQFFIPPGFNVREFAITGQWGSNSDSELLGSQPSSVSLIDFRHEHYSTNPPGTANQDLRGTPGFGGINSRHPIRFMPPPDPRAPHTAAVEPDRMYVAFEDTDRIQVLDPARVGISLGELKEGTGFGVRRLISYFESQ